MLIEKIERSLLTVIRFLLFLALAAPFVTSTYFMYPFMSPAVFFFQICVELATIFFLILILIKPSGYIPPLNTLTISLTIFFAIQFILLYFSIDPMRSLLGSVERMDGVWNLFHFYLFFMVALSVFRKEDTIKKLVVFSLIVSGIIILRYYLSYIGPLKAYSAYSFGNSGFLGNYLLLHIPLAIWIFLKTTNREIKIALIFGIVAYSTAIIHIGNRATFLGWVAGIVILSIYFIIKHKRLRLIFAGLLIILTMSYGTLKIYRDNPALKNLYFIQKITNWSLSDSTVKTRFILWNIASRGFLEKPFFGWGRENFQDVFNKYYTPDFFNYNSAEQWMDRAHNIFFDELITGGLINIISLGALLIIFFTFLIKKALRENQFRDTAVFLGILVLMQIIQTLFTLNTLASYLPFALGLFVIASYYTNLTIITLAPTRIRVTSIFLILFIIIGGIFFTAFPVIASRNTERAIMAAPENFDTYKSAHSTIDLVLSEKNPYRTELLVFEGQAISDWADKAIFDPRVPAFQEYILAAQKKALQYRPNYLRLKGDYGYNLTLRAKRTRKPEHIKEAEDVWGELIRDYPTRQSFLFPASAIFHMGGHDERAMEVLRKALSLTSVPSSRLFWDVALAFRISEKHQEAINYFEKALQLGYKPEDVREIVIIADYLIKFDKTALAKDLYVIGVERYPKDPNLRANLAYLYKKLGDKTRAMEEIQKALELAPEHKKEIEDFIKSLDQ